jgi:hypothetical protein
MGFRKDSAARAERTERMEKTDSELGKLPAGL